MGIDADFYVDLGRDFTDAERGAIRAELLSRNLAFVDLDPFCGLDGTYAGVMTISRYFSADYPRGHWPTLRDFGDFLANMFGVGRVYYWGDSCWISEVDTPTPWTQDRPELEAAWAIRGEGDER